MFKFNKLKAVLLVLLLICSAGINSLFAHCQIPCGIYTDEMRFQMIEEHIQTIEKSINQIRNLSRENPANYNQLVRWINNKEEHANQIQDIVNAYFLTQRIKPVNTSDAQAYNDYSHKLVLLHQILVSAMKTKQSLDLSNVRKLQTILNEFHNVYFGTEEKEHLKDKH